MFDSPVVKMERKGTVAKVTTASGRTYVFNLPETQGAVGLLMKMQGQDLRETTATPKNKEKP